MFRVSSVLKEMKEEIIFLRRELHKIPELGFCEEKTSKFIFEYLKNLGIEDVKKIAKTGIIARIKGKNSEKTIAFRADMDGLPIIEENKSEYKSVHEGIMHGCGHDGHMVMLLILAKYVCRIKTSIANDIVLIFQPAEENPGGANIIVESGILSKYNIDKIFGIHLFPEIEEGYIGLNEGPFMAMSAEIDIDIIGKSAHGAKPHLGIDTISIASGLINDFQKIISRKINPIERAVLTIGKISGGEVRNAIAAKTRLEGTIRVFSEKTINLVEKHMIDIMEGYKKIWNCDFKYEMRRMYPPVINDKKLFDDFLKVNGGIVKMIEPQMLAEDFSYYQKEIPGLFFFLGTRNENKGYTYNLHSSKFNFNEEVLIIGIQTYINMLLYYGSIDV